MILPGIVALLLAGTAAKADDDDEAPHITVRGTATAQLAPDLAILRLGIVSEDAEAGAALGANATTLAAVTEAAKAEGIAAADIEAGTTTLERTSSEATAGATPRVFRSRTALRIRLHDPAKVGAVLAVLAAKGATRVEGVDHRLADPGAAFAKLTGLAVADAQRRAEAAAAAAHVRLGALLSIEPPDEPVGRLDRLPGGVGSGAISTSVEVSYAIDR